MIAHQLFVGCIGEGVFRSLDKGETFKRAAEGMFVECDVRALVVDPTNPRVLYLGSEDGVFISRDGGDNWQALPIDLRGMRVWSLNVDGRRPGRILAGVAPSAIFRSEDGGQTWTRGEAQLQRECSRIRYTRVTCLTTDSDNPDRLWAGIEIDGVHESIDGGKTWKRIGTGLTSQDIHALAVVPSGEGRKRLLAATNKDLNISDDGGQTWHAANMASHLPWDYTRSLGQKVGSPEVVFLGAGDGPPGCIGNLTISRDAGHTWTKAALPTMANSTIWNFATHAADKEIIYASSVSGEVYRTTDSGQSWNRLGRVFGEIRGLAWAPS
jgi:photosystem II stability/assembly factor-like uncharacterized protein